MKHEVPGLYVPEEVVRRLRGVPSDRVAQEGLNLCAEIVEQVREIPGTAGVHLMAFSWEEAIPEILERAGIGRRTASETPLAVGAH
jgi:methylenetetrahydrofolate reductase (NADPH)